MEGPRSHDAPALNYDAKLAELRQLEGVVHAAGMLVANDGVEAIPCRPSHFTARRCQAQRPALSKPGLSTGVPGHTLQRGACVETHRLYGGVR